MNVLVCIVACLVRYCLFFGKRLAYGIFDILYFICLPFWNDGYYVILYCSCSGKVMSSFVPIGNILRPVLNECVTPVTCYWNLALILRDEEELMLVFQELQPPVKMLVPIWKALLVATDNKETQTKMLSLSEGTNESPRPIGEVKQEPYNLPSLYEWSTCNIRSEETCTEVYNLLGNGYVEDDEAQFVIAPEFNEKDVEHLLLPTKNVVDSYVVESPETHEITDFCSFYTLPSSILGNPNYSTLKAAYSFYNVTTPPPLQLMNDALIVAEQKDYDVFSALNVMHNQSFLKELKFGTGCGQLYYYMYNYRIRHAFESIRAWPCAFIVPGFSYFFLVLSVEHLWLFHSFF
ncbi:Glycylpeptide n-tetradecanoyltransferase [Thalictrum thalictroides]|uniref:Glycylpeptide N-tetradecanoyltransferase n=1 Tax=Thalictrum thalictroides TaxID=46969 RepID=A0A7J6V5N2_THATH|nr:Glycylpeptide n-tetradecanoyltransferase [Thalictrum thalictroides]